MKIFSKILRNCAVVIVFLIYHKVDPGLAWLLASFVVAEVIIESYLAFERKKELLAFVKKIEDSVKDPIDDSDNQDRKDN